MKPVKFFLFIALHTFFFKAIAQVSAKEANKFFAPKGNHRSPFKGASTAHLTSVNLRFKLATRQEMEKKKVGNIISWGFLEGIDDELLQEIADAYYKKLEAKFKENGISLSDEYKKTDGFKKLVDKNSDRSRDYEKKNWGVAKVVTANKEPYLEFPVMAGPHSGMGNDLKEPVGQVLITIDFLDFDQDIKRGVTSIDGSRTDNFSVKMSPVIRIEGLTEAGKMRGDGSYALFTGRNWGYTNAIMAVPAIETNEPYAASVDKAAGIPEHMKKFKSAVLGDIANIFSRGIVKTGRGDLENIFTVKADPQAYKAAVLDALDRFNNYLIAYINDNK